MLPVARVAVLLVTSLHAQGHTRLVPNTRRPLSAETIARALGVIPLFTQL